MTKREKEIASCMNPCYDGFSTRKEVKKVKLMARGRFWYDPEYKEYVSFSPKGRRKFIEWELYYWASNSLKRKWKTLARKVAYFWAHGQHKKANRYYQELSS